VGQAAAVEAQTGTAERHLKARGDRARRGGAGRRSGQCFGRRPELRFASRNCCPTEHDPATAGRVDLGLPRRVVAFDCRPTSGAGARLAAVYGHFWRMHVQHGLGGSTGTVRHKSVAGRRVSSVLQRSRSPSVSDAS
jgi:hypothetical protein